MTDDQDGLSDHEMRLGAIVVQLIQAEERGEHVPCHQWIALYPEFAEEISEFLAAREQFPPLGSSGATPDRSSSDEGPTARTQAWTSAEQTPPAVPLRKALADFGDYELLEELGHGGMGVVYKARQKGLNRLVALKMIRPDRWMVPLDVRRFRREAEAIARLDHPNITPIFEVGEHDGHLYYTMKLMDQGGLDKNLDPFRDDPHAAASLMVVVAEAVCHAHQRGILHRDLKPSNILLDAEGRPHITDFGLAKPFEGGDDLTYTGELLGTPSYMAPEHALGRHTCLTAAADVYGLGAVLYALLTGRPPFRGESVLETIEQVAQSDPEPPCRINRRVDRDLQTICLKCLEKAPQRRYACASELLADLRRWMAGQPVRARAIGPAARGWRWCRRYPVVTGLAVAVMLLLTAVIVSLAVSNARILHAYQRVEEEQQAAEEERAKALASNSEAIHQQALALQSQKEAERREREVHRHLYNANIRLAQVAWKNAELLALTDLLDRCRPRPGEDDLRGFEWYYLWNLAHKNGVTLRGHQGPVYAVRFSADGRLLASAGKDGTVILWEASGAAQRAQWTAHAGEINNLCFSPDGRILATAGDDAKVKLWEMPVGTLRAALDASDQPVFGLAFAPDGKTLASGGKDHVIRLWDLATLKPTATLKGHEESVETLAFAPDGKSLASGSSDRTVKLWDIATGQTQATLQHSRTVGALAFAHAVPLLASGGPDRQITFWDLSSHQVLAVLTGHIDRIHSVAFSPDDQTLLSAGKDGSVRLWDVTSGQHLGTIHGHAGRVWSVQFSPDGRTIATAGDDGNVRLWKATVACDFTPVPLARDAAVSLAFSGDGKRLLTCGPLAFWDTKTFQRLPAHPDSQDHGICQAVLSHDGRLLATGGDRLGEVVLRVPDSGQVLAELGSHRVQDWVFRLEFSPDDRWLVSAAGDSSVIVWDVARRKQRWALPEGFPTVGDVAIAPDGKALAVGAGDGSLSFWSVASGKMLDKIMAHRWSVQSVRFSPNGALLATAGGDHAIRLWDPATGKNLAVLLGHTGAVRTMCFSPDGRRLVSGAADATVRVWDISTRQELLTLRGHTNELERLAFSPDGCVLASQSDPKREPPARALLLWRGER